MNLQIHTFGCKVNTYDSGLIEKNFVSFKDKQQSSENVGDVHVLNTCAVTAEATKEAVKMIRRIKAKSPFSTVVVTGCAAQVDTDAFKDLPGADLVVANSHKGLLPQILDQHFKGTLTDRVFKSNIFRKDDLEMGGGLESSHTRSFLKIQDGCNSFCTFCIIPFARGKSRSIPVFELVKKVNELHRGGVQEVVLTGVHVGDYEDQGKGLEDLIDGLLKMTKMPRFRLTSLEPIELTDRLINLYKDPRMCAHFHMSIQSANTKVLSDMKRKYSSREVEVSLNQIQNLVPGAFVGMDVIAGFPTETEDDFNDTYQRLSQLPWTRLHVFPYSERKGTKAAALEETVPWHLRVDRAKKLRELSLHRFQSEALKQINQIKKVLVLKKSSKGAQGLSRDFWPVQLISNQVLDVDAEKQFQQWLDSKAGEEIEVVIDSVKADQAPFDGVLTAKVVWNA